MDDRTTGISRMLAAFSGTIGGMFYDRLIARRNTCKHRGLVVHKDERAVLICQ